MPILAIFGAEDQIYDDPAIALETYDEVPGAITEMVEGAGHSPNVEAPEETGQLIRDFAAEAQGPRPNAGSERRRNRDR